MQEYIMDFGKYVGEPLSDVVQKDSSYIQWCVCNVDNKSFQRAVESGGYEGVTNLKDTTAHNKMQIKFLDEDLLWKTIIYFNKILSFSCLEGENNRRMTIAQLKAYTPAAKGPDKFEYWNGVRAVFEEDFIDVLIHGGIELLAIELKPSLGEDYPDILRQINAANKVRQHTKVTYLIVDKITTESATLSNLKKYFGNSGITLITLAEIESIKNVERIKARWVGEFNAHGDYNTFEFNYDLPVI